MGEIGELVGAGPRTRERVHPDAKALDSVFDSLGPACVHHLLATPQPFGLPPQDRRVARRWLWRRIWARRWKRDLLITLVLVALGLAAALLALSLGPAAQPVSDAVQYSSARVMVTRN